ncbi:MAG: class I SAM-dependent methyltransferase [Armatimonadetes bacterium]|nr:class I SAM-dependent methyltransferase [Armatimonadota bacterium]
MNVDFGKTADDYARHRAGFPEAFFDRLAAEGVLRPGIEATDLGTGTGTVALGLARRGCRVTGIDPSEPMLEQARNRAAQEGSTVEFRTGTAEATGLPEASADLVAAGQCWHWFDRPRAAAEAFRLLRPGGHVVIAHFDWIPLTGNMVEATERLILKHNPSWNFSGGTGLYPQWLRDLSEVGFADLRTFSYDLNVPYTPDSWRGRIRASAGVKASLPPEQVTLFDLELASLLAKNFPGEILQVPHRIWAVVGDRV